MTKKITKKDMFNALLNKYAFTDEERAFIEHELELLNRKSASGERKPTATQVANEGLKSVILTFMAEHPNQLFSITELIKEVPELEGLTTQKVSPILSKLVAEFKIVRVEEKRKPYFQYLA